MFVLVFHAVQHKIIYLKWPQSFHLRLEPNKSKRKDYVTSFRSVVTLWWLAAVEKPTDLPQEKKKKNPKHPGFLNSKSH